MRGLYDWLLSLSGSKAKAYWPHQETDARNISKCLFTVFLLVPTRPSNELQLFLTSWDLKAIKVLRNDLGRPCDSGEQEQAASSCRGGGIHLAPRLHPGRPHQARPGPQHSRVQPDRLPCTRHHHGLHVAHYQQRVVMNDSLNPILTYGTRPPSTGMGQICHRAGLTNSLSRSFKIFVHLNVQKA